MFDFIRRLIPDGYKRALVAKGARWLSGIAAGAVGAWCLTHGVSAEDAASISAAVGAVVLATIPAIYSYLDVKLVQKKVAVAAVTGDVKVADKVVTLGKPSNLTPSQEKELTKILNEKQLHK